MSDYQLEMRVIQYQQQEGKVVPVSSAALGALRLDPKILASENGEVLVKRVAADMAGILFAQMSAEGFFTGGKKPLPLAVDNQRATLAQLKELINLYQESPSFKVRVYTRREEEGHLIQFFLTRESQ